jgi:hypothetical protein
MVKPCPKTSGSSSESASEIARGMRIELYRRSAAQAAAVFRECVERTDNDPQVLACNLVDHTVPGSPISSADSCQPQSMLGRTTNAGSHDERGSRIRQPAPFEV